MSRRGLTFVLAVVLTVVLGVVASVLPVPYVVLVPGPLTDTLGTVGGSRPVVSVTGAQTYPTTGHLYLTTVGVLPGDCSKHPTLWQALQAWFDSADSVQPHQVICPPGQSDQAVQQQNADEMTQSQRDAVTAALLYLGYKPSKIEIVVGDVSNDTPAASVLAAGDVIVAVDGHPVSTEQRLRALISSHQVGDAVHLTVSREGKQHEYAVKTVRADDGRAVIGITPDRQATFPHVNVTIGIDPNDVGGPSAGLAFTLGIIDKLTPGDLTGGRTVAGTGTIDGYGVVGPIGGIQQKIAAAARAHASVFLAPAGECGDATAVAPASMIVVKVDTLATAVKALQSVAAGRTDFPRC